MADPPILQADAAEALNASIQAITNMAESFALSNAVCRIPSFDGKTSELKDFLQDVRLARTFVDDTQLPAFIAAVLGRLTGPARNSCYGRTFDSLNQLIGHLKQRFAPGRDYNHYINRIQGLKMKQGEKVADFYDRLRLLMSAAETCLAEELPAELTAAQRAARLGDMVSPLKKMCRDIFIRGLPGDVAKAVDVVQPADLAEAYRLAVRTESHMEAKIIPDTRPIIPQFYEYQPQVGMIAPRAPTWDPYYQPRIPGPFQNYDPRAQYGPPQQYYPRNPYYQPNPYFQQNPVLNTNGAHQTLGVSPASNPIQGQTESTQSNNVTQNGQPQTYVAPNQPGGNQKGLAGNHMNHTNPYTQTTQFMRKPQFMPPLFNPYPNPYPRYPQQFPPRMFQPNNSYQNRYPYPTPRPMFNGTWNGNPNQKTNQPETSRVMSIHPLENQETTGWGQFSELPMDHLLPEPGEMNYQEWEPLLREMTQM